jgi:fructokinase
MASPSQFGGIEAGGTKFVCAVGQGPGELLDECRFPTAAPDETLERAIEFFRPHAASGQLRSVGIGSFGPIDADPDSPTYGSILSTPKPGWSNTQVAGRVQRALRLPVAFDTDVNAAAMGELKWGASAGLDPSLYLTIGTGIGGGFVVGGRPLRGLTNLEMGHIRIPHDRERDPFPGSCPFHGDWLEGLASGPAIRARFEEAPEVLPDEDPFWELEAEYVATAIAGYILTLSPRIVVLGGGVMRRTFLLPRIRSLVLKALAGYVEHDSLLDHVDDFIVPPGLGEQAGVMGALAMARALAG